MTEYREYFILSTKDFDFRDPSIVVEEGNKVSKARSSFFYLAKVTIDKV